LAHEGEELSNAAEEGVAENSTENIEPIKRSTCGNFFLLHHIKCWYTLMHICLLNWINEIVL
jgi:hypothetical protein